MVATRDRESRDWVEKNLQPVVPIEWYPDLVCSLPTINLERASKTLGIVTRQQSQYNNLHQSCLRGIAKVALERNYRIKQIILATGKTQNNDLREAIEDLAYSRDIVIRTSLDELTKELISCSHIISMKFHGCVMGLLHHIPVLALSQADKFVSFYQDCGLAELRSHAGDKLLGKKFEQLLRTEKIDIPSWIPEKAREGIEQLIERISKS
jgi:polysaccharide pyruvyl transferase WcaK-like protein